MLNTSCQGPPVEEKNKEDVEKGCNIVVATNRLLWKSLVLVKVTFVYYSAFICLIYQIR